MTSFPYFIGMGTSTLKEFSTLEEMLDYHSKMQMPDRHFCKLYDTVEHRRIPGWQAMWDTSDACWWHEGKEIRVA